MKTIFNKGAFKIKVKADNEIKYLDGGYAFDVRVSHFEGGEPIWDHYEITKDLMGELSIVKT